MKFYPSWKLLLIVIIQYILHCTGFAVEDQHVAQGEVQLSGFLVTKNSILSKNMWMLRQHLI